MRIMGAAFGSAGERCMAISVVVTVGDEAADAIIEKLLPKLDSLKVGPYTDQSAQMGPVINPAAKTRIEGYIDKGVEEGAETAARWPRYGGHWCGKRLLRRRNGF